LDLGPAGVGAAAVHLGDGVREGAGGGMAADDVGY